MKLKISGATARTDWAHLRRYVVAILSTMFALCGTLAAQALVFTRASSHWIFSKARGFVIYLAKLRETERAQQLMHRLSSGTVGVRHELSALAVVVAPVLALVAGWWVANSYGYRQANSWVTGTWTGANPQLLVFAGVAILMAVSAAFTLLNSGIIPATLLAMAPIFGIGFTRYGLAFEYSGVVGIPEATAFAGFVAVMSGVPIGVVGFFIGTTLRKGIARFDGDRGPDSVSWEA